MIKKVKGLILISLFLVAFLSMMRVLAQELKIDYELKEGSDVLEITYHIDNLTDQKIEKLEFVDETKEEIYQFKSSEVIEEIKSYEQGHLRVMYEKAPALFGMRPLAIYKLFLLGGLILFLIFLSLLLLVTILLAKKEKRRRLEAQSSLLSEGTYPSEENHFQIPEENTRAQPVEKENLHKKGYTSLLVLLLFGVSFGFLTAKVSGMGLEKVFPYRNTITLPKGQQNISGYFKYQLTEPKDVSEKLQSLAGGEVNFYESDGEQIYYAKDLEEVKSIIRYLGNQLTRNYKIDVQSIREDNPEYTFDNIHLLIREGMRRTYGYSLLSKTNVQFEYIDDHLILGIQLDLTATKEQIEEIDRGIQELIATYQLNEKSPREVALFFHDWLIQRADYYKPYIEDETNQYNQEGIFVHSPYAVICGNQTVCQGYASWFTRAMSLSGFEVYYLEGIIYNDEGNEIWHAWNGVRDGENIYYIDVTFDDPIGSYQNQFHTWDYFWIEDPSMGNTHFEKEG